MNKDYSIDDFDRNILRIVQQSNRATSEIISEEVGLSTAAVQRRLKKMRDIGIIRKDVAVIDSRKIAPQSMTMIVEVSLERERFDLFNEFKKKCRSHPSVQQCYYVTGSADFILIVTVKDMKDYEIFNKEMFFENANVKHFQTSIVMDSVKVSLDIPIDKM